MDLNQLALAANSASTPVDDVLREVYTRLTAAATQTKISRLNALLGPGNAGDRPERRGSCPSTGGAGAAGRAPMH